jgi:hypothetical protein
MYLLLCLILSAQPEKAPRQERIASAEALFTSSVFEGMRGDYFVSWEIPDRLFICPGLVGIILGYPHKSSPH